MPNYNINYTYSPGVAPALVEYYERALLENMKPEMLHNMDAQKRTLPLNNGKTVQFRRFTPFAPITKPLAEGVTPDGQTLLETAFRAMVKPYGGYVAMTDEMQWYMLDNIHQETAKLLADQAALSLDCISRDALNTGLNVQYVGQTSRGAITASNKLTYAEIKKAVRTLKRNNVKPFGDGFYHAIVHPDVVHDLTSDTMWVDVAKYQDKGAVNQYELGTIYKVKFFESTNAKVFTAQTYLYGAISSIVASADYVAGSKEIAYSPATYTGINADVARELAGQMVYITANSKTWVACIETVDYKAGKIHLRWDPGTTDAADWTTAKSLTVTVYGGGASGAPVYSTLVYGPNAYGSVELGGNGRNVQIIVKEPGSSGSLDPLKFGRAA